VEKTAPRIAVPSEPPIDRNSVAPDVATPSISYGTAFWTASTSTCIVKPRPRPRISMYTPASNSLVPEFSREKSTSAAVASAVPRIGKCL
jgi:hypothetical protein